MEKLTIPSRRSNRLAVASGARMPSRRAATLRDTQQPCSSIQIQSAGGGGAGDKQQAVSSRPRSFLQVSSDDSLFGSSTCTDWANLGDGPAGVIAEFALASDVADYVRFRAACRPWRRCSPDPRASGLESSFLPRQWIMLDKALAGPRRRRFLNVSTGECVRMDLPELDDDEHTLLALTPEGLLLLLHEATLVVRLLNPLTHQLTDLPQLTTLLQAGGYESAQSLQVYGVGLVADCSTVAVCFSSPMVLAVSKPGDNSWTVVNDEYMNSTLSFGGRFYCATYKGIQVLNVTSDRPPLLQMVADKSFYFNQMAHSLHLVDNGGELMRKITL